MTDSRAAVPDILDKTHRPEERPILSQGKARFLAEAGQPQPSLRS